MRDAWQDVLSRLGSNNPYFTYDDVHRWKRDDFEQLNTLGLLRETELASHVLCDSCSDQHYEEVLWTQDGRRAFIACPEEGTIDVEPERLRQWRIDADRLAALLAEALELAGAVQNRRLGRLWHLGRRRFSGRFRDFFLAVPDKTDFSQTFALAEFHLASGTGLLILPLQPALESGWEIVRLKPMALFNAASLHGGRLTVDLDYIEDLFAREGAAGKARKVRSLTVADGTKWKDVSIEVSDVTLRIEIGGCRKEFSLEDAGFSERDQRLETLRIFAAGRGQLLPDRIVGKLPDKTPIKTRISRLRQHLQELFPIDGDPIRYNKKAGMYVCNFAVRLDGDKSLRLPAGASWLDLRFHERSDGRLVISVPEKETYRARATDRSTGGLVEEIAQRNRVTSYIYSLEDLGLRNERGQLTPEGKGLIEFLRGQGKVIRRADDMSVLKLAAWLRTWTGLDGDPLQYTHGTKLWSAYFECSSEQVE